MVGDVLAARGVRAVVHQVCRTPGSPVGSTELPDPTAFDLIVVYGSRWSVCDQEVAHWVEPELELLRSADAAGVPVLGLCFGAQMLSAAHGGSVRPGQAPEIGWCSVTPRCANAAVESGPWFQWHFDVVDVPAGTELLASSPVGPQAFRLRRNLALQFHPEVDEAVLQGWLVDDVDQLTGAGVDVEALLSETRRHHDDARGRADRLLEWFMTAVVSG